MLKKLYRLQQLEAAASALDAERINSDEYRRLQAIRAGFDADKKKLAHLQSVIAGLEAHAAEADSRRADLEARLARENQALYDGSVTNSRELKARENQLESLSKKLKAANDEKARDLEQLAQTQEQAGKLRQGLTDMQVEFSCIKGIYQIKQEERDARGRQLAEEKEALLAGVDADSLAWFESHRAAFAGTPVACLDKHCICSGCHTMVPQSTYKRAAQGQTAVCENCGRTLFVAD